MKNKNTEKVPTSILGKWKYIDCTMKNTSVYGELNITSDLLVFDGRVAQDFPTEPHHTKVKYKYENGMLVFTQKDGLQFIPVTHNFLLFEGELYFSEIAIKKPEWTKEDDSRFGANWLYKLKRIMH